MSNNSNNTTPNLPVGDFGQALRGEIKLTIGQLLQRSWDITLRSLPWMLGVFIGIVALNIVVSDVLALVFPFDEQVLAEQTEIDWEQVNVGNFIAGSLLQELILAPFAAMLVYIGMLNAADRKPSLRKLRGVLRFAPQLVLVAFIKLVLTALVAGVFAAIGLLLGGAFAVVLVMLAVIYLQLVMMFAVPLIIDRELNAPRALLASFLVINKAMFPVLGFMALVAIICAISAIPLFLGLIFTLPMAFNAIGVVYHALIGLADTEIVE